MKENKLDKSKIELPISESQIGLISLGESKIKLICEHVLVLEEETVKKITKTSPIAQKMEDKENLKISKLESELENCKSKISIMEIEIQKLKNELRTKPNSIDDTPKGRRRDRDMDREAKEYKDMVKRGRIYF